MGKTDITVVANKGSLIIDSDVFIDDVRSIVIASARRSGVREEIISSLTNKVIEAIHNEYKIWG